MTPTWYSETPPPPPPTLGVAQWARAVLRGVCVGGVTFGSLAVLLLVRLIERPLHGHRCPWTPHITQFVCRTNMRLLGIKLCTHGTLSSGVGALLANHSGWLDIFALNAVARVTFVAKSEVAGWPGIGWLARATGTLFVRRDRREAAAQREHVLEHLKSGDPLLLFPEGTTTDSRRVLPFKPTLLAAFFDESLSDFHVQPVTVHYTAPGHMDPRHYGWWGDMSFGAHLLQVLATSPQGRVDVTLHPALRIADFEDRKALAAAAEGIVRETLEAALG